MISLRVAVFLLLLCGVCLFVVQAEERRPGGSRDGSRTDTATSTSRGDTSAGGDDAGDDDDDDDDDDAQALDDANRRMEDFKNSLNSTQLEALKKCREQEDEVEKQLGEEKFEKLVNLTRNRDRVLAFLTPVQRGVLAKLGVDKLTSVGVREDIVKRIKAALEARETFIDKLEAALKEAVKTSDELQEVLSNLLGKEKMAQLKKLRAGKNKVFEGFKIHGLSKWQKARAGRLEAALDKFICRNLTRDKQRMYYNASHLRRTFMRALPDIVRKRLDSAELNKTKAERKLTKEQLKTYLEKGWDGIKDDTSISDKVKESLKAAKEALDKIVEEMKPEVKQMRKKARDAMKEFIDKLSDRQRRVFQGIRDKLKEVYNRMTRPKANALKMKINAVIRSRCRKDNTQGRIDQIVDWLKNATDDEKKKYALKLGKKIRDILDEVKALQRLRQLVEKSLQKKDDQARPRCRLHYDNEKDVLTVVSFGGKEPKVAYIPKMTESGDINWRQISKEDTVNDLLEKVKADNKDVQEVKRKSGEIWKMSRGKLEFKKTDKEGFRSVGVCHCSGCDAD